MNFQATLMYLKASPFCQFRLQVLFITKLGSVPSFFTHEVNYLWVHIEINSQVFLLIWKPMQLKFDFLESFQDPCYTLYL